LSLRSPKDHCEGEGRHEMVHGTKPPKRSNGGSVQRFRRGRERQPRLAECQICSPKCRASRSTLPATNLTKWAYNGVLFVRALTGGSSQPVKAEAVRIGQGTGFKHIPCGSRCPEPGSFTHGKPRPARQDTAFSLRYVVVVGLGRAQSCYKAGSRGLFNEDGGVYSPGARQCRRELCDYFWADAAAFSIRPETASGWETMRTCEAPLTTTVSLDFARSAIQDIASGGMFLSASP
jgi:hypothetical protein